MECEVEVEGQGEVILAGEADTANEGGAEAELQELEQEQGETELQDVVCDVYVIYVSSGL